MAWWSRDSGSSRDGTGTGGRTAERGGGAIAPLHPDAVKLLCCLALALVVTLAGCGGGDSRSPSTFAGDFETGDLSQWSETREAQPGRISVVESPHRQGRYAGRFEVRPGDRVSTGERAEVLRDPSGDEREGDTFFYAWSAMFPDDWTEPPGWGIILQFHSPFFVSPPLAVNARGNELRVQGGGGQFDDRRTFGATILPTLRKGVWHDFVMQVHWDHAHGRVKVWHRFAGDATWRVAVDLKDVANIQTDDGTPAKNGLRMGLYRDTGGDRTNVVFLDGMRRETTFGAAAESFAPRAGAAG